MANQRALEVRKAAALEQINDRLGRIERHLGLGPAPEPAAAPADDDEPEPTPSKPALQPQRKQHA